MTEQKTDEIISGNGNGDGYVRFDSSLLSIFKPLIDAKKVRHYHNNGDLYIFADDLRQRFSQDYKKEFRHSISELKSYDPIRHIRLEDAVSLIQDQRDNNLPVDRVHQAIAQDELRTYNFKGNSFVDRLDIGRVYHTKRDQFEGLSIERYFSQYGQDPFMSIGEYHEIELAIDGTEFKMSDAYFPKSWENQTANKIVANKYFFKPDRPEWKQKLKEKIGKEYEFSPIHLINRVTNFIADEGYNLGYFKTEEDKNNFADELKWLQINKRFAFNSPVQFNAGLFHEYGIPGANGINYFRDPKTGEVKKLEEGDYIRPQMHACFIKGPRDDLESILNHLKDEGAIFASGSGIGQDIGVLRSSGEPLSCGGKASGPLSFLKIYDDGAGTIKSGGKSRRAARMTTMRYDHPDILNFIRDKVKEDKKCLDLLKLGYSGTMDGEAVRTVTFQNTNISVRAEAEFFEAVRNNARIKLKSITEGKVVKEVSARDMLKEIAFGSWRIGDPAIQYDSKIHEMHPCKNSGRQQSTNPCSEYLFLNDTSCNLLSHNLLAYSDALGNFNIEDFKKAVRLTSIASDIINDAASYPVKDIATISPEFRTIGVGYCNLGALLMRKGLPYDSEEGRALTGAITALMTGTVYETSSEMAERLEPFVHFTFNKKPFLEVMEKHKKNLDGITWKHVPEDLKSAAYSSWNSVLRRGEVFGYRNAQATVLAPTGTISFLMHADTTGIEPGIALKITKELAGGGYVELVNQEVPRALKNLGYQDTEIHDISNFIVKNKRVVGAPHLNPDHYRVFDTAFGDGKGNGAIPFEGHVRMLGAAQPFISGAISKTCNLPEHATVRDIYDSYLLGYELGLKALAVFRDNSKPTAALKFFNNTFKELRRGEKEDLPYSGDSFRQEIKIGGTPFLINVGEYEDGRPGEIVIESYSAGSALGDTLRLVGVSASKSLKRGVSLEDVVAGWIGHKSEPHGLVTIDNPSGPHPFIKQTLSPFDFLGKHLLLHYKGRIDLATEPEKVDLTQLRGFTHGAFQAYKKMEVNDWDFKQVISDPEIGGFDDESGSAKNGNGIKQSVVNLTGNNPRNPTFAQNSTDTKMPVSYKNHRGVICTSCGNLMKQTAPNCFSCSNCGEKVGGCGM